MAAAIDLSAELKKQDIARLMRDLNRRAEKSKRSVAKELKFTGWAVADALRVATKISPKKRPVRELEKRGKTRRGNKAFEVEITRKGKTDTRIIYAKGKREANKAKAVRIENSGLAMRAWHFAQSRLGSRKGGGKATAAAKRRGRRFSRVKMDLRASNPYIILQDRIEYAMSAFKTSGEQTVNNVVGRATRRMEKLAALRAAKHMGAK